MISLPTVKLFANLRKTAGQKELSLMGATLNEVLTDLVQRHPALEMAIFDNGQIRPNIIITLNGHNTTELQVTVSETDTIAIFPPIAGG